MYNSIVNWDNLQNAYRKTRRGKFKYRKQATIFASEETLNLINLYQSLKDGTYYPSPYSRFYVFEPKRRLINAPSYRDKIVQHMLNNVLLNYFTNHYVFDSYACIINKGNRKAVARTSHFLRSAINMYGNDAYVVNIDIKKFFYSIDHYHLKRILRYRIRCRRTRALIELIIDSTGERVGLPLGNLTSQILANVYMNEFDQFVKHQLRIRHYLRYADDVVLMVESKERAQEVLRLCREYLKEYLNLEIHDTKSFIQPINSTVESLGFRHKKNYSDVNKQMRKKIIRYLTKLPDTINVKYPTMKVERTLNSWVNHIRTVDTEKFLTHLVERFPFVYFNKRGVIKLIPEYHSRNLPT